MRRCRLESLGVSLPRRHLRRWGSMRHAVEAGRQCLTQSRYRPADVRVLINAGVHRDEHICEPAIAAYLQHRLNINIEFQGRRTLAFDLLNGGCGMLSALHILTTMMQTREVGTGMVIASEANSDRSPDPSYPYPRSGAALLVDLAPRADVGFGAFAFRTHPEYADLYASVVRLDTPRGRLVVQRRDGLEDAFLASTAGVVDEVLDAEGLRRDEVAMIVPAQISPSFVQRLPDAIGVAPEKVLNATGELRDTLTTSVFLALHHLHRTAPPQPGQAVVLLAWGAGVTAGATVYRY